MGSGDTRPDVLTGFIVFEGLDGSGTTTQAKMLAQRVGDQRDVWLTCEPTDGPIGTLIRSAISGRQPVTPGTLAHLFAADRYEHLYESSHGIVARIDRGQIVISDRYVFSSLAYQGTLWNEDRVQSLNSSFPLPEHVIYIDTPRTVAERRLESRATRDLLEAADVQTRVERSYRRVLDNLSGRTDMQLHIVDGELAVDALHEKIVKALRLR